MTGMSTGIIGRVMGSNELAEIRGELWGAYRDRIWAEARRRGAVMMSAQPGADRYTRHIRFEGGGVHELPVRPPVPRAPDAEEIETMFLEEMFRG